MTFSANNNTKRNNYKKTMGEISRVVEIRRRNSKNRKTNTLKLV